MPFANITVWLFIDIDMCVRVFVFLSLSLSYIYVLYEANVLLHETYLETSVIKLFSL